MAIDREAPDFDLGGHFGTVSEDQLAPGANRSFESAVDAECLFEREIPGEVASPVDEAIECGAVASGFHSVPMDESVDRVVGPTGHRLIDPEARRACGFSGQMNR